MTVYDAWCRHFSAPAADDVAGTGLKVTGEIGLGLRYVNDTSADSTKLREFRDLLDSNHLVEPISDVLARYRKGEIGLADAGAAQSCKPQIGRAAFE